MEEEYSSSDYLFPEAYVEGAGSAPYLLPDLDAGKYKLSDKPGRGLSLGRVVYEELVSLAVDLIEAKITRWAAVVLPWADRRALLARPGTSVVIYEVGGLQTVFRAREGDKVKAGSVLGYVLTGKGETRTARSEDEAVIFHIAWDRESHPPKYIVLLVREEDLIVLEPG